LKIAQLKIENLLIYFIPLTNCHAASATKMTDATIVAIKTNFSMPRRV
jgi:hypothetical protein